MEEASGSDRPHSPDLEAQQGTPSTSRGGGGGAGPSSVPEPVSLLKVGPGKGNTPASGRRMRWADESGTPLYELKYFERSDEEVVGAALRETFHVEGERDSTWVRWREATFHLISVVLIIAFIVLISFLISRIS